MNSPDVVIGLEIHVQLKTHTKLFCGDDVVFDAAPNSHVCPVCLGLPGALPVLNRAVVELALKAAAALACEIHQRSQFTRKNYFYPDLPKGYQITQYEHPLATHGQLTLMDGRQITIRRAHVEEDAGKLLHDRIAGKTAVDMNRAGVPLLEIVTEPELHSPSDARAFLSVLKRTLQYLAVSDCEMEKGSLRVDANVSIAGGGRTEIKNLNSFAGLERALRAEIARQTELSAAGLTVGNETFGWNDVTGELRLLRAKEELGEYRYIPEPDLPPLVVDDAMVDEATRNLPLLPVARAQQLQSRYGLRREAAETLTSSRALADYFEELADITGDAHAAAVWCLRDVLSVTNVLVTHFPVSVARLAELLLLVRDGNLSSAAAHNVFRQMCQSDRGARDIIKSSNLTPIDDGAQATAWVREILQNHPAEIKRYQNGEARLLEYFVGQLMRVSNNRLDARKVREIITREISALP
jgi:aspartyl-tRNA(Asn)/glutamyl-tRNA(Gln) amidotransferase subunit B